MLRRGGDAYMQIGGREPVGAVRHPAFCTVLVPGKQPEDEAVLEDRGISCCDGHCINSGAIFEHFLPLPDHLG